MTDFMAHFLLSNLLLCICTGILLLIRKICKNSLSCRTQYHLWLLLLGLFSVPFIPLFLKNALQRFSLYSFLKFLFWHGILPFFPESSTVSETIPLSGLKENTDWMTDFAISVNNTAPAFVWQLLWMLWLAGVLIMLFSFLRAAMKLRALKRSALPLQNGQIRRLYRRCLLEAGIQKAPMLYSTVYLKSPVIAGLYRPCIYLPASLVSDPREISLRYMLLHELQHYKHHDIPIGYLINLFRSIYWFNPVIWYALKEMTADREIACDAAVLEILSEDDYIAYGNTLIDFAERISHTGFPFVAGLGSNIGQLKRRILNIASYQKTDMKKRRKGLAVLMLTAVLFVNVIPLLPVQAAKKDVFQWNISPEKVSQVDLSACFEKYQGSFVLYDSRQDIWYIHNRKYAKERISPDSTYKIYDALFALEKGIITPENSQLVWDKTPYPFDAWNRNQTLSTAMSSSVNWYFQALDQQLGDSCIRDFLHRIEYGNESLQGDLSSYWLESSLKISPIEQVLLLSRLQDNSLSFAPEYIQEVKAAICLSSSDAGTLYGKTGTGRINGQDVNGWFVGFLEVSDNTYLFATNIQADHHATGSNAAKVTFSALSEILPSVLAAAGLSE